MPLIVLQVKALSDEATSLQSSTASLAANREVLTREVAALQERIAELMESSRSAEQERTAQLMEASETIAAREQHLEVLNQEVTQKQEMVAQQQEVVNQKQAMVAGLEQELEGLKREGAELEVKIGEQRSVAEAVDAKVCRSVHNWKVLPRSVDSGSQQSYVPITNLGECTMWWCSHTHFCCYLVG